MKSLTSRLAPNFSERYFFDDDLEGLRGVAAVGVMLTHGLGMYILDSTFMPGGMVPYFSIGALAVHLFLMLSGYVIGQTLRRKETFSVSDYYLRRWVRIHPLYLVAFISLLFLGTSNTLWQTIGNLLMLQNNNGYFGIRIPVEPSNVPLWSINYEIVYYLILPAIIFTKPKPVYLLSALFFLGGIGYFFHLLPVFLTDYSIGYIFWITGLIVSWNLQSDEHHRFRFLSYVFLMMSYNHFIIGSVLLKAAGLSNVDDHHGLGMEILANFPLCLLILCDIAKREIPYKRQLTWFVYALPLLLIAYLCISKRLLQDVRWIASTLFYILSVVFYAEKRVSTWLLKKMQFTGRISYAIYIFHYPIALLIGKYFPYRGDIYAYCTKFVIWVIVTFFVSYAAERILQPKLKAIFINNG